MTTLFIAEKPSVARAIADAIGIIKKENGFLSCKNDVLVTWCFGHLLEMAKPDDYLDHEDWRIEDLPIIPQEWKLFPRKDAKAQFKIISQLLKKSKAHH